MPMDISIPDLIQRLLDSGLTQSEISKEIPCAQSSVSTMKNGGEGTVRPSHRVIKGLHRIAKKRGVPLKAELPPKI